MVLPEWPERWRGLSISGAGRQGGPRRGAAADAEAVNQSESPASTTSAHLTAYFRYYCKCVGEISNLELWILKACHCFARLLYSSGSFLHLAAYPGIGTWLVASRFVYECNVARALRHTELRTRDTSPTIRQIHAFATRNAAQGSQLGAVRRQLQKCRCARPHARQAA